jgi:hypothetical protein
MFMMQPFFLEKPGSPKNLLFGVEVKGYTKEKPQFFN